MRCIVCVLSGVLACGARSSLEAGGHQQDQGAGAGGGALVADACAPGDPPVALASDLTWPYGIVTDGAFVYFTTYIPTEGAVWRVPKVGGSAEPIAPGLDHPSQLVLVGDSLYVTESGANRVVRIPRSGGEPIAIANGQGGPAGIAFDGADLFWANHFADEIVRSDLSGTTTLLATPTDPFRIAAGGGRVYYTALGANVSWVAKDGSSTGLIASPSPRSVAFGDDGLIYWTDSGLWRANADGSNIEAFGGLEDGVFVDGLAIDDEYGFVALSAGDIVRFSLADHRPAVMVTGQDFPAIVAVDQSCVYWTNTGSGDGAGSVMRAPRE